MPHVNDRYEWYHQDRFRQNYMVDPETGCWLWTGRSAEYGMFKIHGRDVAAHRIAYMWWGAAPFVPELLCDHLCLNKKCVNPAHIEQVTPGENLRRAWAVKKAGIPDPSPAPRRLTSVLERI